MPTTTNGLVYPASTANTQLWTHFQNLAESADTLHQSVRPLFVRKTADETISNTTALQSDDALVLTPAINKVYTLEGLVLYTSGATPDFKMGFTFPAAATLSWNGGGANVNASSGSGDYVSNCANRLAVDSTFAFGGGGAFVCSIKLDGLIIMGGTAGSLTLRWAQNTAEASNTVVKFDSWLRLTPVA